MSSLRRYYLDRSLNQYSPLMKGRVLDIGGKKINRRGSFINPVDNIESWEYLNIDETTNPDYCCSAEIIPIEDSSIDTVLMMEVLEYLPNPKKVLGESYRILSDNGCLLISVPFLHPVHGDYLVDRVRYTPVMLSELINESGFSIKIMEPMGSVGSVLYDILRISFGYADENRKRIVLSRLIPRMRFFFLWLDNRMKSQQKYINTGYFLVLNKNKLKKSRMDF